jgi:hypothetical protein
MTTPMNPEIKARWLAALRSGLYPQTRVTLRDVDGYCCLGVLCNLHAHATGESWHIDGKDDYSYLLESTVLPPVVVEWAGLPDSNPAIILPSGRATCLAQANDGLYTFAHIADLIDAQY